MSIPARLSGPPPDAQRTTHTIPGRMPKMQDNVEARQAQDRRDAAAAVSDWERRSGHTSSIGNQSGPACSCGNPGCPGC